MCSHIDQKQSWSGYNYTYKFVENPLNDVKQTNIVEVHTTYEIVCNGIAYIDDTEYNSPNDVLCYVNNIKKERLRISKKMYNINSNSYKNITANKNVEIIKLYDDLEKYILSLDKKIIRNFLHKGIVFKYKKRILEVLIKQQVLTIVFLKNTKQFDDKNLLYMRKGYEKDSICYCLDVGNKKTFEYACNLFKASFEDMMEDKEKNRIDELFKELSNRIKGIHYTIKGIKMVRGTVFKGKRNFCILEKRKYGIQIRLLSVKDNDNILNDLKRTHQEPLCKYFNVLEKDDINKIIPYLKDAFELTKYPALDVKNKLIDLNREE